MWPFLHPAIFATGLAAASIPIIIHILNRRRFRIREWAAMKFLLESIQKNRRRIQIEELILLAIRTLVVVLLALAISRFTGCGADGIVPGGGKTTSTTVYVLDDSASVGQKVGSGGLFSVVTTDLAELIQKAPSDDQIGIILTSRPYVPRAPQGQAATQPEAEDAFQNLSNAEKATVDSVVSRLQGLKPSDARTSLADALASAQAMLSGVNAGRKQIVVLSDFRKADFTREQNEAMRKKFQDLKAAGVRLTVMDYGRDSRGNLTIEGLELVDKFAVAKQACTMRLSVRNNGATQVKDVEVKIRARFPAGDELKEVSLPVKTLGAADAGEAKAPATLDPGEVKMMEFQVKLPQAGAAVVTADLPADDLIADNSASLAVEARDATRVLLVDGAYDVANPYVCESYYMVRALDPKGDGNYGNKVDVIPTDGMGNVHLDDYDLVMLLNVPSVPTSLDDKGVVVHALLEGLEAYVMDGGGLAIFTGDKIHTGYYGPTDAGGNGRFYNGGSGLLPLPLLAPMPPSERKVDFFRFDSASLAADSLLRAFLGIKREGQDPTQLVRVYDFNPSVDAIPTATSPAIKPARVLARFNDPRNSPAIVARDYGKGTVVLFCTSASRKWNDWPVDEVGTFIATMNDAVMVLARRQRAELTAKVGEPILYELPSRLREARVTLKTPLYPAQDVLSLTAKTVDGRNLLRYDRQRASGVYTLALRMPDESRKDVLLAQNVDPLEGQLTAGHKAEIASALGNEKDFVYIDKSSSTSSAPASSAPEKEYWMWALAAMLVLMAAETFLGQKFGHYA